MLCCAHLAVSASGSCGRQGVRHARAACCRSVLRPQAPAGSQRARLQGAVRAAYLSPVASCRLHAAHWPPLTSSPAWSPFVCPQDALDMSLKMALSIPLSDILAYRRGASDVALNKP